MSVIKNVNPRVLEKLMNIHDKLYCQAKLSNEKSWGINDTLTYLIDNIE